MLFLLSFFLNLDAVPNVLAPGDDSLKFIKLSRLELERNERTGYPTMPQLMFSVCFRSLLVWLIWSCRLKTSKRLYSALIHVLYTAFSPPSQHSYDSFENKISLIQGPSRLAGLSCYLSADFNGVSMIPDSGLIYLPNGV